jgi:SAM-dependent methyltransferase
MGTGMAGYLTTPDEPLAESAPVAWALAPRLCAGDPSSLESCVWYHRIWQYLRLLDIITSIRTNTPFLLGTLQRLAPSHPRVLISGSADYAMLAHLRQAYGARPLDVTMLDRCATSVAVNEWYADRYGMAITSVCGDALTVESDRRFDLVCTHNFVGRFDPVARQRLIDRWHSLLRPGGVVVTTQRVRPGERGRQSSYSEEAARALAGRIVEAAKAYPRPLGVPLDELGDATYEYARRKGAHAITSAAEIVDAFERAGFEVNLADEGGGQAERESDRPSSTAGRETFRMRIIATRT